MPKPSPEERIKAVRWKLGLLADGEAPADAQRAWADLEKNPAELAALTEQVAKRIARLLESSIRAQLLGRPSENYPWAAELVGLFVRWARENERVVFPKLAGEFRRAVEPPTPASPPGKGPTGLHPQAGQPPKPPPPVPTKPERVLATELKHLPPTVGGQKVEATPPPLPQQPPPLPPPLPAAEPPAAEAPPPPPDEQTVPLPNEPAPQVPGAMWRYKPLPAEPDKHTESDARALENPPPGFRLIGARVRGKKHKHDGTNCDDWFHFEQAGPWTVIAVSDGAGSAKFSRVGAKAACEAAARELAAGLAGHSFEPRGTVEEWRSAMIKGENGDNFLWADIQHVQDTLHRGMRGAHGAVLSSLQDRAGRPEYQSLLRRPLELKDLSCTLLLAVHRTITVEDRELSFVMACQVGDGITGVIHRAGTAHPIGSADSGGYSGETEFLTSSGKVEADALARKTDLYLGNLQALMVMTDGVADDYFPAGDHLGRLWADLIVNRIPDLNGPSEAEVLNALAGTPLPNLRAVAGAEYIAPAEVIDSSRQIVWLRSSAALAEKLGVTVDDLLKHSAALWAGAIATDPLPGDAAQDRLRTWLDAYHVRGSFDDRTLVVLHREALP